MRKSLWNVHKWINSAHDPLIEYFINSVNWTYWITFLLIEHLLNPTVPLITRLPFPAGEHEWTNCPAAHLLGIVHTACLALAGRWLTAFLPLAQHLLSTVMGKGESWSHDARSKKDDAMGSCTAHGKHRSWTVWFTMGIMLMIPTVWKRANHSGLHYELLQ